MLLLSSGGDYIILNLRAGLKFRLHKTSYQVDSLLSANSGAIFALVAGTLRPISRDSLQPWSILTEARIEDQGSKAIKVSKADNRCLNDNNQAQHIRPVTVRAMQSGGKSGAAIIEALTSGSSTWGMKTDYSKAKWLKRKARKHMPWVQVLDPAHVAVAEALFARTIGGKQACRPDVVSQLLARGNIKAGSHVIVMDSFHGIVLGAIAERTGVTGNIIFLHEGPQAAIDSLVRSILPPHSRHALIAVPVDKLVEQGRVSPSTRTQSSPPNLTFEVHALVASSARTLWADWQ